MPEGELTVTSLSGDGDIVTVARELYQQKMLAIAHAFKPGGTGIEAIAARTQAVDELVLTFWQAAQRTTPSLQSISLLAIGGYGRRQLFPSSDIDLLFLLPDSSQEKQLKGPIRLICQQLWDSGVRVSPVTRTLAECDRVDPDNIESALALLDQRLLTGDERLAHRLSREILPRLIERERRTLLTGIARLTRERHKRYGNTLFHLEPNVKDCPGGLRDANVCGWIRRINDTVVTESSRAEALPKIFLSASSANDQPTETQTDLAREFTSAFNFLASVRCFLHLSHGRDINTLDWKSQDAAAASGVGIGSHTGKADAAYWMQLYFRHARVIQRGLLQHLDEIPEDRPLLSRLSSQIRRRTQPTQTAGFRVERNRLLLDPATATHDSALDPDIALNVFQTIADTGARFSSDSEERLGMALPILSAHLEEGPAVWNHLRGILCATYAGTALRSMHALGILELLVPEFHGIDALVIRDAYHRYTVDEHTFVLIDTLHGLEQPQEGPLGEWAARFRGVLKDLQYPELLYLAALLHDTGKGRSTEEHTQASARLASSLLNRLECDAYDSSFVIGLIANHLEMSNALRRDIFDAETVRAFAAKVPTPEELRMITLFTYADINAVHPDALTPWKAENLWRLYIATSNYLDRNIDDERIDSRVSSELVHRVTGLLPGKTRDVLTFLEGLPQRYLQTRTPEQIRSHFLMAERLTHDTVQLDFQYAPERSEITLITHDRTLLFARVAGTLAAWGMNIVTADAFSNAQGIVVDSFRFTDAFRTLELNPVERDRFVKGVHDAVIGEVSVDKLLSGRKRTRRRDPLLTVETRIEFDSHSSTHSTLLQVISQDTPGLLYTLALALGQAQCSIEVAVIDTEGETVIDVFYLTHNGQKLDEDELPQLQTALAEAIEANAK